MNLFVLSNSFFGDQGGHDSMHSVGIGRQPC